MKILWIINIPTPEASELLNIDSRPFGGWLDFASKKLSQDNVELNIAFPHSNGVNFNVKGESITYFTFSKSHSKHRKEIKTIISFINPDIVHIYGTEFSHSYSTTLVTKELSVPTIISVQGLVSEISKHMYANLDPKVIKGKTIRNMIFRDHIEGLKKKFEKRGMEEIETIKNAKYVIGRTTWDYALTKQMNCDIHYFFCNETLREDFYKKEWNIENIEKHSIFLSQASYSIKGLHHMLKALSIILRRYPDTKLYVAGKDLLDVSTIKAKLKKSYYDEYIKTVIKLNNLQENVIFLGELNEKEMIDRYLKSNVFVCPSSIENSPNSVGEAMLLGVPVVASYVGGVPDMLEHNKEGFLYQSDSPSMLAFYVEEIFSNRKKTVYMSNKSKQKASVTHDPVNNLNRLQEIYIKVIENEET